MILIEIVEIVSTINKTAHITKIIILVNCVLLILYIITVSPFELILTNWEYEDVKIFKIPMSFFTI